MNPAPVVVPRRMPGEQAGGGLTFAVPRQQGADTKDQQYGMVGGSANTRRVEVGRGAVGRNPAAVDPRRRSGSVRFAAPPSR